MSPQHKYSSNRLAILSVTEEHVRRFWLTALAIGTFFVGYYYFYFGVPPTPLPAGPG